MATNTRTQMDLHDCTIIMSHYGHAISAKYPDQGILPSEKIKQVCRVRIAKGLPPVAENVIHPALVMLEFRRIWVDVCLDERPLANQYVLLNSLLAHFAGVEPFVCSMPIYEDENGNITISGTTYDKSTFDSLIQAAIVVTNTKYSNTLNLQRSLYVTVLQYIHTRCNHDAFRDECLPNDIRRDIDNHTLKIKLLFQGFDQQFEDNLRDVVQNEPPLVFIEDSDEFLIVYAQHDNDNDQDDMEED